MVPPERRSSESADQGDSCPNDPARTPLPDTDRDEVAIDGVTTVPLPDILREDIEDAPFWKEVVAFAHMPQASLDPYFGKFVAVYNGRIVDSDADERSLVLRFYRTYGYVPVYIHEVGIEDSVIDIDG
jgi:hypothetical protein